MKSLLFSLSGILAFTLGVMANLELVLPDSVVRAADTRLPFDVQYSQVEEAHVIEGFWSEGTFYVVTVRVRNESNEDRVFPEGSIIVTDGQAETVAQHAEVRFATRAQRGSRFWAPGEVRELELTFDVPLSIPNPRLELEAAAFASPDATTVLGRRVLENRLTF